LLNYLLIDPEKLIFLAYYPSMKKYLVLIIPVLILSGCNKRNSFTINGKVNEASQNNIYIHEVDVDTPVLIDSAEIDKNGVFRFRIKATEPDFYQVGYSSSDFITLLAEPGERIDLSFNGKTLSDKYTVSGSKSSELIRKLDQKLFDTKVSLDSIDAQYKKASVEPGFEKTGPDLEQKYLDLLKEQRKFNIGFVLENMNSLAAIKALYQRINENMYVLYEPRDLQYLKIVSDSLKRHYPDSKHTKALVSDFEQEKNQFFARSINQIADTIPETKLNPDLKDINGKRVALSSLRGKYVLLAFWSADSRDCISENLQLKEFYKTYNKSGFEIYQINVDQDEEKWKAAVKFDELPWINTREDDPANPKNAILFNVRALPTNYLYDPEGNIIGSNLHGRSLQIKLAQIFK
jgi:thiol-disulfide isomerase/thioredoxin